MVWPSELLAHHKRAVPDRSAGFSLQKRSVYGLSGDKPDAKCIAGILQAKACAPCLLFAVALLIAVSGSIGDLHLVAVMFAGLILGFVILSEIHLSGDHLATEMNCSILTHPRPVRRAAHPVALVQ